MANGLAVGLSFPLLAPNGTAAAPSYSFATAPTTGFYYSAATILSVTGVQAHTWGADYFQINNAGARLLFASDVILARDAPNVLAQRNGTAAQMRRVYNTYTDASNYERGFMGWSANVLIIGTEKAGTGSARDMTFRTDGTDRWNISPSGHFKASTTNTYDIGATAGANCPRNIYAGTSFLAPDGASATPSIAFATTPGNGFYYINSTTFGVSTGALVRFVFSGVDFKVGPTGLFGFGPASALSAPDTGLGRLAAASLRLGLSPSATPIAQTFTIGEASRPGTDTDVGGASGTIASGLGTGAGAASSLIFQTPTVGSTGSTVQSLATRLTVATAGITATVPVLWSSGTEAAPGAAFSATPGTGIRYVSSTGIAFPMNGTDRAALQANVFSLRSVGWFGWTAGTATAATDLVLSRHSAANLRQGAAADADADGVAQTLLAPDGGTVSAGTTGRAGANYIIRSGIGSDAKAGSGANGGPGGDFYLRAGAGGAGDGAGVAGTMGSVYIQTNATTRLTVSTTAVTSTLPFLQANGTAAAPSYAFTNLTSSGLYMASTGPAIVGLSVGGTARLGFSTTGIIHDAAMLLMWSSTTPTGAVDLSLARLTTASLRLGAAPSATPVNQIFTIGESSRGGTDLNVAGANGTIRSGLGTGNAAGTSLIFQVSVPLGSSTVAQTYTQVMSLSALGATFDIPDQGLRINGQVSGAGASAGTLTNAPAAGNPTFWLPISIAGTIAYIPCW